MRQSGRRAGQNVRDLAVKRRIKAIGSLFTAGGLLILPFLLSGLFHNLFEELSALGNQQNSVSLHLPWIFYLPFGLGSLTAIANGIYWWKRANRADQGAKGEEDVSKTLTDLAAAGWQIEYGLRLGKGLGDADIFCTSPQQKCYVIDVKSHRGRVMVDGQKLYRMMGKQKYVFEKDFFKQALQQATQIRKQRNLKFVTPIVAFSDARVMVPSGKISHVYVVEKSRLSSLLQKLG